MGSLLFPIRSEGLALAKDFGKKDTLIYGLLDKCEVKMGGYWPSSFFTSFQSDKGSSSRNLQKKRMSPVSRDLD